MGSITKIMKKLGEPPVPEDGHALPEGEGAADAAQDFSAVEPDATQEATVSIPKGNDAYEAQDSQFQADPNLRQTCTNGETAQWDREKVDPAVIAFHNRYASICEQYRSVRARLLSMNAKNESRIIAVTSSVPEEGKSVTSVNLAIAMSEGGEQRVLLADADFRRSSLATMVGIDDSPGLAEVFLGRAQLKDVIRDTPYPNLKLIPAGRTGDRSYGELLASATIREVLAQLRGQFNYTFLDMPPVNTVSDVSMMAPICDGALMVVEMGRTPEPTVQLAVRTLQTNNVEVIGCVLSRYNDRRKHYYDRYYRYYHRR